MSTIYVKPGERLITSLEDSRGTYGMWLVIATEASLFVTLFCSYFLIGNNKNRWTIDQPPKIHYALIMLAVLLSEQPGVDVGREPGEKAEIWDGSRRAGFDYPDRPGLSCLASF